MEFKEDASKPIFHLSKRFSANHIDCEFIKFEMLIQFGQKLFLPRISPILSHSSHKQAHQFSQTTSNRKCSKHGQSGNDKNMFSPNLITFILFSLIPQYMAFILVHSFFSIWHSFLFTNSSLYGIHSCSLILQYMAFIPFHPFFSIWHSFFFHSSF